MTSTSRPSQNAQVPALILLDSESNRVDLKELWAKGPTLLTFLRNFG